MTVLIRDTTDTDLEQVLRIHQDAFGGDAEARLVRDILHDPDGRPTLSLLAADAERPLGHVLFSRAHVTDDADNLPMAILAPLAVVPAAQGRGIGSALVKRGLDRLAARGVVCAFVLGDPGYYRRFDFEAAVPRGLLPPYSLPEAWAEAWMVRQLAGGRLTATGTLACGGPLMKPELWRE